MSSYNFMDVPLDIGSGMLPHAAEGEVFGGLYGDAAAIRDGSGGTKMILMKYLGVSSLYFSNS